LLRALSENVGKALRSDFRPQTRVGEPICPALVSFRQQWI
jgi:hypothetical protein